MRLGKILFDKTEANHHNHMECININEEISTKYNYYLETGYIFIVVSKIGIAKGKDLLLCLTVL